MATNKILENNVFNDNDEINLSFLFNTILRNKYLIAFITFFSILISIVYQKTTPKTWEGQFQIVMSKKGDEKRGLLADSGLASIVGGDFGNNNLKTEVGILKSPSVLMPIFNYVKTKKKIKNPNSPDLLFNNWKRALTIELKKNTSILDINYIDQDKELIIEVLEKLSKAFQSYSGRNKLRDIEITKNYLINQISIYKSKSAKSIKEAQDFAMKEDLFISDGIMTNLESNSQIGSTNNKLSGSMNSLIGNSIFPSQRNTKLNSLANTSLEKQRIMLSNKIRNFKKQIEILKKLDVNDREQIKYIGASIIGLQNENLLTLIEEVENKLADLRLKYLEKDSSIKKMIKKRDQRINLLKEKTIGILNAQILSADALIASATRPEGVILRYKELMREAERDEKTLLKLEDQYRVILLEAAKSNDPWELITVPTLLEDPAHPPRLRNLALFGLIGGLLLGISYVFYKEKRSGKIYESEIIENLFGLQTIINLIPNKKQNDIYDPVLIKKIISDSKCISFLEVGFVDTSDIQDIKNIIIKSASSNLTNKDFKNFNDDYVGIENSDKIFLLLNLKAITIADLNKLKERIAIYNLKLDGIILS